MWKINNLKYIFQAIYNEKIKNTILHLFIQKTVISGVPNIAGKYFQPLSPQIGIFKGVTYFFLKSLATIMGSI